MNCRVIKLTANIQKNINKFSRFISYLVIEKPYNSIQESQKAVPLDVNHLKISEMNTNQIIKVLDHFTTEFQLNNYQKSIQSNETFERLFLTVMSRAYFLKAHHILPLLSSCSATGISSAMDENCWQIIGRLLNNHLDILDADTELMEICSLLLTLKVDSRRCREMALFWRRVDLQLPNWVQRLPSLELHTQLQLLEIGCLSQDWSMPLRDLVLHKVARSESLFYRVSELPEVVRLCSLMNKHGLYEESIISRSLVLLSEACASTQFQVDCHDLLTNIAGIVSCTPAALTLCTRTIDVATLHRQLCTVQQHQNIYSILCDLYLLSGILFPRPQAPSSEVGQPPTTSRLTLQLLADPDLFCDGLDPGSIDRAIIDQFPDSVRVFCLLLAALRFDSGTGRNPHPGSDPNTGLQHHPLVLGYLQFVTRLRQVFTDSKYFSICPDFPEDVLVLSHRDSPSQLCGVVPVDAFGHFYSIPADAYATKLTRTHGVTFSTLPIF